MSPPSWRPVREPSRPSGAVYLTLFVYVPSACVFGSVSFVHLPAGRCCFAVAPLRVVLAALRCAVSCPLRVRELSVIVLVSCVRCRRTGQSHFHPFCAVIEQWGNLTPSSPGSLTPPTPYRIPPFRLIRPCLKARIPQARISMRSLQALHLLPKSRVPALKAGLLAMLQALSEWPHRTENPLVQVVTLHIRRANLRRRPTPPWPSWLRRLAENHASKMRVPA